MQKMTGAECTVRLLERQGITTIAGIPGGTNLPLYDALSRSETITHILARHEQGAGFIAQGMARTTGKPAVCLATSGPGATNLVTAIADAKLDSVPLVCITGQVPTPLIGTDAFQEVDTYGMSIPITKHNFLVRSAQDLLTVIPEAFRIAMSCRPGPVLVDIPRDVQVEEIAVDAFPLPASADAPPVVAQSDIEKAAQMINSASRPVLWVGGGVVAAQADALCKEMAETASMPVTMTLMGLSVIPRDHELNIGMLGMHAERYTNMAMEGCDLIVAAGVRFDDRATGKVNEFCPNAKVIHIDIDHCELDKLRSASLGILGDIKDVFSKLLPKIDSKPRKEWNEYLGALKAAFPQHAPMESGFESPQKFIRLVGEIADDSAIVTTDVGKHQMWTAQSYPFTGGRQWLTSGGLGTMGFGLPVAIGAALAAPDKKVLCFSGDGSLLMNIQELATAVEHNVNITVILFNNQCLGLVHQQQELFFEGNIFSCEYPVALDYVTILRGFGWHVCDLAEDCSEEIVRQALATEGPCLIHMPVSRDEKVLPMVPPGAANRVMIGGDSNG
ncbi:acetolactate synthase large subunit [Halodesulfovibrio spirochaetisodalis]|uniref:Acetolactate synthase n=1 Tax=Halodesulfovibrio spirochaetisodalis TaxID=1560234 RepID=A0A1B7XQ71_9BACT|nr:acetolactate synthase large subunit [Halodesulfovibrio spirochaetisodalis]OBQ57662.1 acetolactate synthase catalytic subunit [Halodesulfovibrio spirochaetisodalis]